MKHKIAIFITAVMISTVYPAWAHHSHANYSETEWMLLEGTVREIHWMNPHSWIYLEVVDADGATKAWALEGASVTTLRRDGWTQDSVEVGDNLSLRCHPLKDGSRGCLLGYITMDDGSEKEFD
jgi:hypothetical protein